LKQREDNKRVVILYIQNTHAHNNISKGASGMYPVGVMTSLQQHLTRV